MSRAGTYQFQVNGDRASAVIEKSRVFLQGYDYPLGTRLLDHLIDGASADPVIVALAHYQNSDGGFGRGLEVDMASPASNPFATRLAMTALTTLQSLPESASPMMASLADWLTANQAADGDWHLSSETRNGKLAPWFAAWEHPNLNPALCIAGFAHRLRIGTPDMQSRTASLFRAQASVEMAASADFYGLLPYVEYVDALPPADRDVYLDAISANIHAHHSSCYADAGHFWEQVLAAGPDLVARLDADLLDSYAPRLLNEQDADGGWPTPYDQAWRPWATTMSACIVHELTVS